MSMTKAAVVATASSTSCLIAGVYVGYVWTKKRITEHYEAWLEEQVQQTRQFYAQRYKTDEYSDPVELAKKWASNAVDEAVEAVEEDIQVVERHPVPEDFTPDERTNYNRISTEYREPDPETQRDSPVDPDAPKVKDGETMEEFETRLQDDARSKVNEILDKVAEDVLEEREGEPPVASNVFETNGVDPLEPVDPGNVSIISLVEFAENEPEHTQNTITWYAGDGILADDQNTPISNLEQVIGSTENLQFGYDSDDPNIVYLRNPEMGVDFEVCLDDGSYSMEVLGVPPTMVGKRKP